MSTSRRARITVTLDGPETVIDGLMTQAWQQHVVADYHRDIVVSNGQPVTVPHDGTATPASVAGGRGSRRNTFEVGNRVRVRGNDSKSGLWAGLTGVVIDVGHPRVGSAVIRLDEDGSEHPIRQSILDRA